ncbi:MAG: hypothetical protein M3O70_22405 [Actinomycetota bacterium]|nr:hypothetical protein [Actinomycetota bacterium]
MVVGEVADNLIKDSLDRGYEHFDWLVEDIATGIDDSARWVGDRAEELGRWTGDRVEDVGEAAEGAGRWLGDRAEDLGDAVEAVTPW